MTVKERWKIRRGKIIGRKSIRNKQPQEVSWTQENHKTSLDFIHGFNLPPQASTIDIGGGDSKLVDNLIDQGFEDITVLDISERALNRAKERLGDKAENVSWYQT